MYCKTCDDPTAQLDAELEYQTEKAMLFNLGLDEPVWIPKSVIVNWDKDESELEILEWFAIKQELV